MKIKEIFSFFERAKEEKEKQMQMQIQMQNQKQANMEHHNFVMSKIEKLKMCSTRTVSNNDLIRFINEIWDLIKHSADVCGKGDHWAEDEWYALRKVDKNYDLRVENIIIDLIITRGHEITTKFGKIYKKTNLR